MDSVLPRTTSYLMTQVKYVHQRDELMVSKTVDSEKTEDELIGMLVKLRKRGSELGAKIEKLLGHDGDFQLVLKTKWEGGDDPERLFKNKMSVDPDRIIKVAETLKALQEEYKEAHRQLREFENKYPSIAKSY